MFSPTAFVCDTVADAKSYIHVLNLLKNDIFFIPKTKQMLKLVLDLKDIQFDDKNPSFIELFTKQIFD